MTYQDIIKKVSEETGISNEIVDKSYKAFWLFIKESIQKRPLKEGLTEDEFLKLRPNFNVPSLGKLVCPYNKYVGVKERFNHIRKLREKNEKAD